jgi:hypothetical protein
MADIVYFDEPGQHNTDAAFSLVKAAIQERGFKKVVLASTKGFTANLALEWFGDMGVTLIAVGVSEKSFPEEVLAKYKAAGHIVKFSTEAKYTWPTVAVNLLRRFCEGMKVIVQIVLIAMEEGVLEEGEEVIAIAGTEPIVDGQYTQGGADTVVIMEACRSDKFFETEPWQNRRKIREILCKPR